MSHFREEVIAELIANRVIVDQKMTLHELQRYRNAIKYYLNDSEDGLLLAFDRICNIAGDSIQASNELELSLKSQATKAKVEKTYGEHDGKD